MRRMSDSIVERLIEIGGGQSGLAKKVGVTQQTVWYWRHKLGKIPAERVLAVENATGVPRHEIRPDLFPAPAASAA